jgi:SnoaL-like domain
VTQRPGSTSTGRRVVDAFAAGDAAGMTALLAPTATFHSPVTDYEGRERVAEVFAGLVQVLTDPDVTLVLEGSQETAAFFTVTTDGRRADGVLLVRAAADEPAGEVTLMLRPLKALLAGIEQMKVLLGPGGSD